MTEPGYERSRLGVGIIGCGRMGTHRARLAAGHPAVEYVALMDIDAAKAESLGAEVGAQAVHHDAQSVIDDPRVTTVVVSTPEPDHVEPVVAALRAGKPVLVEKPIATSREDADQVIAVAHEEDVLLRVGYSQRFRRTTFLAKRYSDEGKLGQIVGGTARVYNTRAHALAILKRAPHVSPVVDVLTYYVDLVGWFMGDNHPVEVYAAGTGKVLRGHVGPDGPDDITSAVVRYEDGAVVSFTISYALPAEYPSMGQAPRIELVGTEGVLLLDEENKQNVLFSDLGLSHAYVAGHDQRMGYLATTSSGDWALGRMFGPIADETRAWLDHLSTGAPEQLTTPEDARRALEVTLAMEASVESGRPVKVDQVAVPSLR